MLSILPSDWWNYNLYVLGGKKKKENKSQTTTELNCVLKL